MKRICVLLLLTASVFAQRLPQTILPSHYKLSLDPSIEDKRFFGDETIDVRVTSGTKEVVLNSLDLDISDAQITANRKTLNANVVYDKHDEMVKLEVSEEIPAGDAQIRLKFAAKLTEGLRGLYLSKSSRRQYAVTQFEGTYARMMFPCFDEPSFKATFDLTVTADKGDTAISNGHIVKDEPIAGDRHEITFSTSPKMSTYLVALAIGDWQCLSRVVDGVPLRICAAPEKKEYGAFALDVAAHSIQFYNQWYGIKYPFGKLDMLAIPDYEWGGMENTASIFYRDTALLVNEKSASALRKRGQASTIAHEIAHQWFGDLVTPAWWDDIWLNEGFATWMSVKPIQAWHPEWRLENDAAAKAQRIIGIDSLASARAIHGNPSTPSEIKEMFDGITYEKGAAVLRMLESYLGPEVFRKGVNAYLAAHANGNATSADFWQAEAEASAKPVDKIMSSFVMQPGVPMVSLAASCNGNSEKLELKQQRFLISSEHLSTNGDELWQIPICTKSSATTGASCGLMASPETTMASLGCADWVFGNRNAQGYYRVAYSSEELKKVAAAAEDHLNVPERIALVEDAWATTHSGKTSVADFLGLSEQLRGELNLHVIDSLANHLRYLRDSLVASDQRQKYQAFIRDEFVSPAAQLGWDERGDETDDQRALRASLLGILGDAGDPDAIRASRNVVNRYMSNPSSVDATLVGDAFTVVANTGDQALYDRFVHALNSSKAADEYYHYLYALTDFRQPELINRTISLLDQGKVRQQDYPRFFGALLANPAARDATWKYLKDH
ncbi:MAG TPA: M1 family metallopeptidase [Terriglobales bacterium]|nr:M1 family metallopeptidase [Terriglobales bacterium]